MPKVDTAVIAAAGAASRMWPTSKAIPKEMLPIGRSPALLYLLDELDQAGIERVVIVVGEDFEVLMRFLREGREPPAKVADVPPVRRLAEILERMRFSFLFQRGPYGNGTPLVNASELIGDAPCIYAFCDDVVLGESASKRLIEVFERTGAPCMTGQEVAPEDVQKFGIIECEEVDGLQRVRRLIEKPAPGVTESRLATLGRYLVTPEIIRSMRETAVGKGGELWFTDSVVQAMGRGEAVYCAPLTTGRWRTVGDPKGYGEAVMTAREMGVALY
ncbi:MAG: NTP transferase domain-containing protein [Alphaproteobacteria bacterium]|nr:NTP transferase domain-containing protein [Alphaproteobacteria bacterium]MCB9792764.1 NTP transferase domain-containing protein [Alphaproteobacteria bacterium]